MIFEHTINGLTLQTGDLICTTDGGGELLVGEFWRLVGKLIPGDVDHIAVYTGPGGRCVEAGAMGRVIEFEMTGDIWDADAMYKKRNMIDTLYGVAYPLEGQNLSREQEDHIREKVAAYCMTQANEHKPYNLNFLDSGTESSFYCSQLAYVAYRKHGIELDDNRGIHGIPGTHAIVFPQEIWDTCAHQRVKET